MQAKSQETGGGPAASAFRNCVLMIFRPNRPPAALPNPSII
ncbi:hypothetical protein HMPREF0239_02235 [Clostridium sp. ATCC BAA-442]|nr:hypothetical protein HMPREF0239_02235 [Clostridium sp. ATCC BAA-442]